MRKALLGILAGVVVGNGLAQAEQYQIHRGWNLLGAVCDIPRNVFNNPNIISVWRWTGNTWEAYSPNPATQQALNSMGFHQFSNIPRKEGFWINARSNFTLNVPCGVQTPPPPGEPVNHPEPGISVIGETINQELRWRGLRDLDTHIMKIDNNGRVVCHVFYGIRRCGEIVLDNDDTSTNGRETSHINGVRENMNYVVYVYNYGNTAPLGNGNGREVIFCGTVDGETECNQPAANNDRNKRYWLVYTIRNGHVEICEGSSCIMTETQFQNYLRNNFNVRTENVRAIIEESNQNK